MAQYASPDNLDHYNPEFVEGEILVKFKDEVTINKKKAGDQIATGVLSIDSIFIKWGITSAEKIFVTESKKSKKKSFVSPDGKIIEVPELFNIYKLKASTSIDLAKIIEELKEDQSVEFAEPNYYVYTMETYPDDPLYEVGEQWYIDAVNVPAAWDSTTSDTNQIIGIIDTGVDWDHPDLDDNIWRNWDEVPDNGMDDDGNGFIDDIRGWDFINNDNDPNDDNSHGTHVAGIAAAESNNGIGITGIAWNAKIMPVKMLQSSGQGSSSDLASAIIYASDNGATVINMSLGSYGESLTVKAALENAYAYTVLVAAAGNDGYKVDPPYPPWPPYAPMFPACYPFVIGVEATTQDGKIARFSNFDPSGPIVAANNFGHNYEIKAPGVSIYSASPNGNYKQLSGTSMSSPIVSGAVALMKSYDPSQSTETLFAKLIQGSINGLLNIGNSLNYSLTPDLYLTSYIIIDTLPYCDNDGVVDAGETISLLITVKNFGGFADSVFAKIEIGEFEDTAIVHVIDNSCVLGNLSSYSFMQNTIDKLIVYIDSNTVNARDIVLNISIGSKNYNQIHSKELILTIQNGEELVGVMDSTLLLTNNKLWLVNGSFKIGANGHLVINPGVELITNNKIVNNGIIEGHGTIEMPINIYNTNFEGIGIMRFSNANFHGKEDGYPFGTTPIIINQGEFINCYFSDFTFTCTFIESNYTTFNDCSFKYFYSDGCGNTKHFNGNYNFHKCNFENLYVRKDIDRNYGISNAIIRNCNFSNIYYVCDGVTSFIRNIDILLSNNNILTSSTSNFFSSTTGDIQSVASNYWGTTKESIINDKIYDFWDDASLAQVVYVPILVQPSDSAHGCVWMVKINGIDPQDEFLNLIGAELLKFEVYFNRAMDTSYTPFLTFGVREPYNQHIVKDNAFWSTDSTKWNAYYNVGLETGDGTQTIRVVNARDDEHFEIPIENSRFKFVIQAAGAASIAFQATPRIGKVDLEWPSANTEDILGYNIYRYQNLSDSTFSDTVRINTELVVDTFYTDFDVIPGTTYHFLYKILGTDMQESDFSKSVSATPFSAANGDVNGDMMINVLDITTIVDFMLLNHPNPFLFDAADLNGDDEINVLDIISIINIILSKKSDFIQESATYANFSIKANQVWIGCNGSVAAYQFVLKGDIEGIGVKSLYPMETFTKRISKDEFMVIVFSLNQSVFQEGNYPILSIFGDKENGSLTGYDLVVSDIYGQPIEGQFLNTVTYVPEVKDQSLCYTLEQNHPNPFNISTRISYILPYETDVIISIYNTLGELVYQYYRANETEGKHTIIWNGEDGLGEKTIPPGIYFYQLRTKDYTNTKRMIYMKD